MGEGANRALTQEQVRAFARQQIDAVEDAEDRAAAAAQALQKAGSTPVREAVLEMSLSAPEEVSEAFVRSALKSGDESVVRTAAESLMHLADLPGFLGLLRECLESEETVVRQRAVEAVDQTSDPEALDLLAEGLVDEDIAVRRAATGTLEWIAASRYRPLKRAVLEKLRDPESTLFRNTTENDDPQVRLQMARALGYSASGDSLPLLEVLTEDEDREVRHEALMGLANISDDRAEELVAENIPGSEYVTISSVLDTLATRLGPSSARLLDFIKICMDHQVPEVRRHAVLLLYKYRGEESKELLLKAAKDPDFEVAQRAADLLRTRFPGRAAEWLEEAALQSGEDSATLAIWEAGNLGAEIDRQPGRHETSEEVEAMLERTAVSGSPSARTHAVSELCTLRDIAESDALQAALNDDDSSVRSAAADSLTYTRDAGYLVRVVREHSDPLIRRRALEALIENPGGSRAESGPQRTLAFSYTRTAPVSMFRYFLDALEDEDEGVKRFACEAIGRCAEGAHTAPVRLATEKLDRLARSNRVSQMTRETASRVIEEMEELQCPELVAECAANAFDWLGTLAAHADAFEYDEENDSFRVNAGAGLDPGGLSDLWVGEFHFPEEETEAVVRAARENSELSREQGRVTLKRLIRSLRTGLTLVCLACRALRLVGVEEHAETVGKWLEDLRAIRTPRWPGAGFLNKWEKYLNWLRASAEASAVRTVEELKGSRKTAALDELAQTDDRMVKISALTERGDLESDPADTLSELADLCEAYEGDAEYAPAVGRAAMLMLNSGKQAAVPLLSTALQEAHSLPRLDMTWKLTFACQEESVAKAASDFLAGADPAAVSSLAIACALTAAGRPPEKDIEEPPDEAGSEAKCAHLALQSMKGDTEAAEKLEDMLRRGSGKVQFYSALYLGLARVWSATAVLAAVSDSDVPFLLRLLCGSMLVRRGHSGSLDWFQKVLKATTGTHKARTGVELAGALEDSVSLMLHYNDVNVGRFV